MDHQSHKVYRAEGVGSREVRVCMLTDQSNWDETYLQSSTYACNMAQLLHIIGKDIWVFVLKPTFIYMYFYAC